MEAVVGDVLPLAVGIAISPGTIIAAIKLLLGSRMLVLVKQWRGRPHDGDEPTMPAWMTASVAVPAIGYLVAAERMSGPLEELRYWLTSNNATVMAVLLLVIGVMMIGKGIGSF